MKELRMRWNNLTKYDAPLRIQYQSGYDAFYRGGDFVPDPDHKDRFIFIEMRPKISRNTMQYREWQRGWNTAYFENLRKVKSREQARARRK